LKYGEDQAEHMQNTHEHMQNTHEHMLNIHTTEATGTTNTWSALALTRNSTIAAAALLFKN